MLISVGRQDNLRCFSDHHTQLKPQRSCFGQHKAWAYLHLYYHKQLLGDARKQNKKGRSMKHTVMPFFSLSVSDPHFLSFTLPCIMRSRLYFMHKWWEYPPINGTLNVVACSVPILFHCSRRQKCSKAKNKVCQTKISDVVNWP